MVLALASALAGCGMFGPKAQTVATDLATIDKPVLTRCTIDWPALPVPHVANVQLSGDELADLVLIWRAAEAELEERIAYERQLEAAARKCVED